MSSIGDLFFTFRGEGSQLERDAQTAGTRAGDRGGTTFGQRFNQTASRAFTAGGAAMGTFVAVGVEQFGAFEEKMNEVFTLLPGISQDAMGAMQGQVMDLARETGRMPDEVIPALYQALSAGVPTDNVFEFLRTANKTAVAGAASTEDSVNLLSAVTKAYGDTSLEANEKVGELAFKTVQLGQTTFPELAAAIGKVTPQAAALGVTQEELFGITATLTGVTGNTAEVMTQQKAVLTALIKTNPKMTAGLKEMGYETGAAAIESLGLHGTLLGLQEVTGGNTKELAEMLGSAEALTAVLALTGAQSEVAGEKIGAMREDTDLVGEGFDRMDSGIAASGRKIAATVSTIAIGVGEKFQAVGPALLALNQGGMLFGISPARLFGGVGGALTGKLIPSLIGAIGGAVPALAGAMTGLATGMVGLLGAAIPIAMAALPFILVGALIAAIIAVIAIPELREKALEIGGAILGAIGDALGAIGEVFGQVLGAIGSFLGQVIGQVGSWGSEVVGAVASFAGQIVEFILSIPGRVVGFVGALIGLYVQAWTTIISTVVDAVGKVVGFILGIPGRVASWVGELIGGAARAASGFIGTIVGMAGDVVSTILGLPGRVIGGLVSGFADMGRQAVDAFLGFIRGIPEAVGNIIGGVGEFIGGLIPQFATGIAEVPRDMLAIVHAGEMIIPADDAEAIRQGRAAAATAGAFAPGAAASSGPTIIVHNPEPEPASRSVARELRWVALSSG